MVYKQLLTWFVYISTFKYNCEQLQRVQLNQKPPLHIHNIISRRRYAI